MEKLVLCINPIFANNNGGRSNQAQLQSLRTMVQMRQSANALLTESYLAALQGNSYVRTSAPIESDKTESNQTTLNQLTVVPNPASNQITVYYNGVVTLPTTLNIFASNGTLVKSINVADANSISLNIADLKTGLYYCQLKGTNTTGKIIVIK